MQKKTRRKGIIPPMADYLTFEDFIEQSKGKIGEGQMRNLLYRRGQSGLDACVRKIGKRLYISTSRFNAWVELQGDGGPKEGRL